MKLTLADLEAAQLACVRALAAAQPDGALGHAIQAGLIDATRRAIAATPVDTGSWRASHRPELSGLTGTLTLDAAAKNVRSGTPVRRYAGILARTKGGRYDVYKTVYDQETALVQVMTKAVLEELP